ncbi:peptide chain release factor N(5)-glutamine methyltransferase [Pseudodesulfovibrio sp. zrk46]|uniref:peptide chain release factor N(5)-glutamine methyltransferase n=1 Tax=Pseudodesulfovibrio sp. zrk46 TaxID=2725288 RepID=UPI001449F4B1|nr:peptide chain release factor N(5)-glutamine methyltransferase [Pseudodesulfovibrio sp. zrk46]QJB57956.1 peptide chain release factor N(5)-glutamine methyltransferase [Pseudodesulfovibrio sp. zrk46]
MAPTILDILQESESRLSGVDSPRLSAEVIVAEVLDCSRLTLVVDRERVLKDDQVALVRQMVARRETGEPLAYILGNREFYGLDFHVSSSVLIPRPETEHIIEKLEELYPADAAFQFADLGTGSGILAVTIAHLFAQARGVAVDLSPDALAVAERNSLTHGVHDRLEFIEGDFTCSLLDTGVYDLIVSNPPYVPQQEYDDASHEVRDYEPLTALVSGEDGLNHIRAMLPHVSKALKQGGIVLMEIGYQQGDAVKKIMSEQFPEFGEVDVLKDLSGHDRIVFLRKL